MCSSDLKAIGLLAAYAGIMSRREIETILKQVEQLLATAGTLPAEAEEAVEKLLNVVESLCSHNQTLLDEVKRLRLEQKKKKKPKTTDQQYCGNMSEPKIREFLENFDVQISAGSMSNIFQCLRLLS